MSASVPDPSTLVSKHEANPLLPHDRMPFMCDAAYNAGVIKYEGEYIAAYRNEAGHSTGTDFRRKFMGLARSRDGISWDVQPTPFLDTEPFMEEFADLYDKRFGLGEVRYIYDPRLTVIEGQVYLCVALDTEHGVRGAVLRTIDFERFEVLNVTTPDNRNMVLFPERIGGRYVRLERPFPVYGHYGHKPPESFDIWLSQSPDLRYWGDSKLVLGCEELPYANAKIGPAAPPLKTAKGWLTTIHGVWRYEDRELPAWHDGWNKAYYGGICLLDRDDPSKLIGLARKPLLVPDQPYETEGMRGHVIFPGGMILEDGGEVRIYYGAADTRLCLATADLDDLLAACEPFPG